MRTCSVGDPAGLPSPGECCNSSSNVSSTQSAYDPCSQPPTPPDSPQAECSSATYPRCRHGSHRDSFAATREETAAAMRTSKEWPQANFRNSSDCQSTSSEAPRISREVSRDKSEPFASCSPPVSTGSIPFMRKGSGTESSAELNNVLYWKSCGAIVPSTAHSGKPESSSKAQSKPAGPTTQTVSAPELASSAAGSQLVAASGNVPSSWNDVPDDVLRTVFSHMPSSYVRVARLVCKVSINPFKSDPLCPFEHH